MIGIKCGSDFGASRSRLPAGSLTVALLACLVLIWKSADVVHGEYVDAYQQLESNGFPTGLLPHTVTSSELQDDGSFVVYLGSKCKVNIPSAYPVQYSKKITGKLSYGKLKDLTGIQVKVYFVWVSITTITLKGDDSLEFSIGWVSSTYPIHPNFDEEPDCEGASTRERLRVPYLIA